MDTETISPRLVGFDTWDDLDILEALWHGQIGALAAVRAVLPAIASAARDTANRLEIGGRLIFVGAGTSAAVAALEAAEIPITFGWPKHRIVLLTPGMEDMAPGGTEDDGDHGTTAMQQAAPTTADVVVALAASGETPFTCAAAAQASAQGAVVIALFNRDHCTLRETAHHPIFLNTGNEIPAGSTRMNAGTGQKATLNLLSVLVMTRLGRIYDGMMVELTPNSSKLRNRAVNIIANASKCSRVDAERFLLKAGGNIKQAIMVAHGLGIAEAETTLMENGGNLRLALESRTKETKNH